MRYFAAVLCILAWTLAGCATANPAPRPSVAPDEIIVASAAIEAHDAYGESMERLGDAYVSSCVYGDEVRRCKSFHHGAGEPDPTTVTTQERVGRLPVSEFSSREILPPGVKVCSDGTFAWYCIESSE